MTDAATLLVRGGTVVDGTGAAGRTADVLVTGTAIAAVAPDLPTPTGAAVVDASGKVVVPGFVDVHSHDDVAVLKPAGLEPKLRQGVTLTVVGNCGHGVAPSRPDADLSDYSAPILGAVPPGRRWPEFGDYLADVAGAARRTHVAALVPHGPLRAASVGTGRRPADTAQIAQMCGRLDEALSDGALGLSLGLMYPPGNAATREELVALAAVVARRGRLLVAHIRNEGDHIRDALEEVAGLGRETGAAVHVSHLKVTGPANHGRMPEILAALDAYRDQGIDVTADVYPYEAGSTTASTLLPPWTADGGLAALVQTLGSAAQRRRIADDLGRPWEALENYFLVLGPERIRLLGFTRPEHEAYEGRSLAELAVVTGASPADCLMDLVRSERGGLSVVLFQMSEVDVRTALSWRWAMVGSDGLPVDRGSVHPRLYGTFPRVLRRYAGDVPGLDFPEAVRRMTALPAARFGLRGRGVVAAGTAADLVVLDPARVADTATYDDPRRFPEGVDAVVVDGRVAWSADAAGPSSGRLVRGGQADPR